MITGRLDESGIYNEALVRCFSCSSVCKASELGECCECGALSCGSLANGCSGRCACAVLRVLEDREDAEQYHAFMDEMSTDDVEESRYAFIEGQLDAMEERHGW
jgi:hypothetical protein